MYGILSECLERGEYPSVIIGIFNSGIVACCQPPHTPHPTRNKLTELDSVFVVACEGLFSQALISGIES